MQPFKAIPAFLIFLVAATSIGECHTIKVNDSNRQIRTQIFLCVPSVIVCLALLRNPTAQAQLKYLKGNFKSYAKS